MSILNPGLLWPLLPLALVPLLVHLFNRKFPQKVLFSSVERIRKTMAQRSKLFRFRHLLMTLLRTLIVLLLVLVFLQPLANRFGEALAGAGQRHVLILFDNSLSMGHGSGLVTARRGGLNEASRVLDGLGGGDLVNVVAVGRRPVACFFDYSANHDEARRFLEALPAGAEVGDFREAVASAADLASKVDGVSEIYLISDFQRRNWANADFLAIPPRSRLFFMDAVAGEARENRGVVRAALDQTVALAGETLSLEIGVGNFSAANFAGTVEVSVDDAPLFAVPLTAAPWSVAQTTFPFRAPGAGVHTITCRLPADDLPGDDARSAVVEVLDKERVVIATSDPDAPRGPVPYLVAAMNPYADLAGSIIPEVVPTAELDAAKLASTSKLVLARAGRLTTEQAELVAGFLSSGGGVIYFLDGDADAANLAALDTVAGGSAMPLELAGKQTAENFVSGAQKVLRGDFRSRFLRLFRGADRPALAQLDFYEMYRAAATESGEVVLRFTDGTPAMASGFVGLGTVLLCNFSAAELTSNLARQPVFPAWVQEMIKNIGGERLGREAYEAGDEVATALWLADLDGGAIIGPEGTEVPIKVVPDGQRARVTFRAPAPGTYLLKNGGRALDAFAVNTNEAESDLRPIPQDQLPQRAAEAVGERAHYLSGAGDLAEAREGRPVFHYFLLAALVLLLVEALLGALFARGSAMKTRREAVP